MLFLVLLTLIGIILGLLIDEFDHYLDEAPMQMACGSSPGELTEEPDAECPLASMDGLGSMFGALASGDPFWDDLGSCFDGSCIKDAITGNLFDHSDNQLGSILSGIVLGLDLSSFGFALLAIGLAVGLTDPLGIGFILVLAGILSGISVAIVCQSAGWSSTTCISSLALLAPTLFLPVTPGGIAGGLLIDSAFIFRDLANCW